MASGKVKNIEKGNWAFTIYLPRDEDGKYQQIKRQGFPTREAADKEMRRLLGEVEAGNLQHTLSVAEYLDLWLNRAIKEKKAPRTFEFYTFCVERIKASCGRVKLDKLEPHHIEKLYDGLSDHVKSSTLHAVHRTFRAALNRAVKWGYLKESPMARVDAPSLKIGRRNTLSVDEAFQALDWLKENQPVSYIGTFLAIHTGMRKGEIAGLMWSDVDLQNSFLDISRSRQRVKSIDIVGDPKTEKSARTIPVSEDVVRLLKDWHHQHLEQTMMRGDSWTEDTYVLSHLYGAPYDPNKLMKDLRKAEIALNLPKVSFHDLRHTHATILLEAGTPLKSVSERLGHSTIRLTADTYAHVTEKMAREAVDNFSRAFKKSSEK